MAIEVRIVFTVFIWLTSVVYSQSITVRPHDYGQLSKAVDEFLDILIKEANNNDNKIDSWQTWQKEDINPKLRFLSHVLRSMEQGPDMTSFSDPTRSADDSITRYLQALLSAGDQSLLNSQPRLPFLQPHELSHHTSEDEGNIFWADSSEDSVSDDVMYPNTEEKRNGIWYGKRSAQEEPSKRNGIWYGKRTITNEDKRNGIWYGKRNGIWYGKRNGIWYGKRDDGLYPAEVL